MRVLDRGKCTVLLLSLACSAPSVCPAAYPGHPCSSRATEQHAAARVSPRQFGDHAHSSAHGRLHTACTCKGPGRRAQQARPPRGLSVLGDFSGTLARYEFAGSSRAFWRRPLQGPSTFELLLGAIHFTLALWGTVQKPFFTAQSQQPPSRDYPESCPVHVPNRAYNRREFASSGQIPLKGLSLECIFVAPISHGPIRIQGWPPDGSTDVDPWQRL
jgi:hypothetical protein